MNEALKRMLECIYPYVLLLQRFDLAVETCFVDLITNLLRNQIGGKYGSR